MKRVVLVAAIVVTACSSRDVALLPDGLWVSVHDANDRRIGGFAVRTERYLPTMEPAIGGDLSIDARDRQGRVINGWGFYGWPQGDKVRVLLLAQVEMAGEPKPASTSAAPALRWEELGSYLLAPGESRAVKESSTLGLGPMTIRLGKTPGT
jgi:hypothetical protein